MGRNDSFRKNAVVYDLDGTQTNPANHAHKHMKRDEKFAKAAEDAPEIKKNVSRLKKDAKSGKKIVVLTARSADYKKETKKWLKKHDIEPDKLVMRPKDDSKSSDKEVKEKLLKEDVTPDYKVEKAYDDRKKNVKMMRKHGINAKEA